MLNALRVGYFGRGSSGRSMGRRPPLHPSQPGSVRSIISSTLCGAKCYKSSTVLDPSRLADVTQAKSTGRPSCKTSMSSGKANPQYPNPPMETAADSASSLDSAVSSTDKDNGSGKGQRHSPFKRLIKLVSPIKGLPGLLSNRKVSKKESSVDKPTKEGTQPSSDDVEDDISVLELPVEVSSSSRSHSKEPTRPALLRTEAVAGPSAASNGSESKSSQVSDTAEAGVASINCKMEPDLPGMVSSTPTGVSGSKSNVNHAPQVLAPLRGPLPSVSSGADAKPSSVQTAKRKTPLYRMKMLLDLKRVTESSEEAEKLPHIPTLKEWVKQEKRKEKEAKKAAKKAMKIKEKQLKKELKQEQKATGNKTKEKDPAKSEANSDSLSKEVQEQKNNTAGAQVKTEPQPKMAWGEVKEEASECSGSQPPSRRESGAIKMPPLNESREEPQVASVMRNSKRTNEKGRLQHPLGAHPRRRRSTLINIQEKSPQHYSRPDSDSRSDMSSDELEKEHKLENDVVHTRVRPLAAHHSRRRVSMASRLQNSLTSAGPTCAVANNNVDRDMEDNMKPKQGRVQEPTQGQSREHLPPCQRKLAWTH